MRKALKARCIIFANNKPLYDHAIIVNDNMIEEIIPNADVSIKKNKIINLSNSILMPGLINAHIHLELEWVKRNLLPFSSFASWLEQIIDLKKGMNQEFQQFSYFSLGYVFPKQLGLDSILASWDLKIRIPRRKLRI